MADPDATSSATRLAAYDAAADDPTIRAAFIGLDEHYHAEHHDAEDDDSIEVCCVAAMLEAAGFADTYEAYEDGRKDGREGERERWTERVEDCTHHEREQLYVNVADLADLMVRDRP